jgi:hypothetical protein
MSRVMLTEDQINVTVKAFLEARGWLNVRALSGKAKGVDVIGDHPGGSGLVLVESKGGTSGESGSANFGVPCTTPQIRSHVAKAVFTALCLRERSRENTVLIALPDDDAHESRVLAVESTLKNLNIGLLAVSAAGVRVVFGSVDTDLRPAAVERTSEGPPASARG